MVGVLVGVVVFVGVTLDVTDGVGVLVFIKQFLKAVKFMAGQLL